MVVVDEDVLPLSPGTGNQGSGDLPVQLPMATGDIEGAAIPGLEGADRQQLVPAIALGG
ncbi:hypothetical protein D3C86_1450490 [compost metagenome]